MQLLIDSVKYQLSKGLNPSKHIIRKIKNDEEALKEACITIRDIIAECIERKLPVDDGLVALHVATIKNQDVDYAKVIEGSKHPHNILLKQNRSAASTNFLRKVEESSKVRS